MTAQAEKPVYCSFCAKSQHELEGAMIQGFDVAICQGCVQVCVGIIFDHSANRTKAAPAVDAEQETSHD